MKDAKQIIARFLDDAKTKMEYTEVYLDAVVTILQSVSKNDHAEELIRITGDLQALTQRLSNLRSHL